MTVDLKGIKVQSQSTFSEVVETSDDNLYFVEAIVVVNTFHNGTEWYRVYSDGWCEQGGYINPVAVGDTASVTLHKPLENSGYTLNVTNIGSYSNTTSSCCTVTAKAYNSFSVVNGCSTPQAFNWEAKGYIG